jgi:hypothetical protein
MKLLRRVRIIFYLAAFFCLGVVAAHAADPVVVELHYQNGVKFYKRGLYDRAIAAFEKVLSLEPGHVEARDYLEKVKHEKEGQTRVEAKKSETAEIRSLYDEGKRLYTKRDYNGALEVFSKILEKKPVDDFASFYKERCEILISRQLAREKKIEEKNNAKEQRKKEIADKKSAKQAKKAEREDMLEKRREINEERRSLKEEKVTEALEAESAAEATRPTKKEAAAREKRALKEEKRAQKLEAKNARIIAAQKAKEDKIEAVSKRREEKRALKEEKRGAKNSKKVKIEQVEGTPVVMQNKELFLKGVEQYGRKEYEEAVASFGAVIEAESSGRKLYTNSAKRLMDKTKKKLKASEEKEP